MRFRRIIATGLVLLVTVYLLTVLIKPIPKDQRLDVAEFGLILMTGLIVSLLVQPDLLSKVRNFKLLGLEVELERLREDQQKQKDELDDVRMVLTLLLQKHEVNHLRNLAREETGAYRGSGSLRAELRKLRDLRLIRNRENRNIGELRDGRTLDLRDVVVLTPLGQKFLERLDGYQRDE